MHPEIHKGALSALTYHTGVRLPTSISKTASSPTNKLKLAHSINKFNAQLQVQRKVRKSEN